MGGHLQSSGFSTASRGFANSPAYVNQFRIVTGNGDVLDVTQQNNPDLFRAVLGGAGPMNYGIVTQYETWFKIIWSFSLKLRLKMLFLYSFCTFMSILENWVENFHG